MAIGDLYTARFQFESVSSGMITSMSYKQLAGTNDENTMRDLAVALGVSVEGLFKALLSRDVEFTGITVNQTVGLNETPGLTRFVLPNIGLVASDAIPMGGCCVMSILTDAPNAKFNGRMFVSGIPESSEVDGAVTAAAISDLNDLGSVLDNTITSVGPGGASFEPSVISRFKDGIKRAAPIAFKVLSITADAFIKNQRRRNTRFIGVNPSTP